MRPAVKLCSTGRGLPPPDPLINPGCLSVYTSLVTTGYARFTISLFLSGPAGVLHDVSLRVKGVNLTNYGGCIQGKILTA